MVFHQIILLNAFFSHPQTHKGSLKISEGLKLVHYDLMLWTATFEGAPDSIWEGGLFTLKLVFNERYPNCPPKIKFLNKMFHPNIYNDGRICLDMLYNQWSPIYDVWAILTAIKTLLTDPNTQSPANIQASNVFRDNKVSYQYRVKEIVQKSLQYMPEGEEIIKQTQIQKKQREAQEAKAQKLQKQRRQKQAQKHTPIFKSRFSSQPLSKVAGLTRIAEGIYTITNSISNEVPVQQNSQSFQGSQEEDSSENPHTEDGSLKEVLEDKIEMHPIKLKTIENKVVQTGDQNLKEEQKESTEVVIPVINIVFEKPEIKIEESQAKQSNQEAIIKQDQPIVQKEQKQQNKVQQSKNDKNEQQQDQNRRKQATVNRFQEDKSQLDQEQQQEQLESEDDQSEEEYEQYSEAQGQCENHESQEQKQ